MDLDHRFYLDDEDEQDERQANIDPNNIFALNEICFPLPEERNEKNDHQPKVKNMYHDGSNKCPMKCPFRNKHFQFVIPFIKEKLYCW